MSVVESANRKRCLLFGMVLCLLAVLFAIEAKLAWYAPDSTPTIQISSAKLQDADAPRLVAQALASSQTALLFAGVLALLLLVVPEARAKFSRLAPAQMLEPGSPDFCVYLFIRPPPAR